MIDDSREPEEPLEWEDVADGDLGSAEEKVDTQALEAGRARVVAELPDKSGSIILAGPGAGTAVPAKATSTSVREPASTVLPTRDQALASSVPLMLLHRPHQQGTHSAHLLASVLAVTHGAVAVGATVALGTATATSHQQWLAECAVASVRIADPRGFLLDPGVVRIKPPGTRALGWAPYLRRDPLDVEEVLQAQREVGANVLLSPGRALEVTNPQKSLDVAFAHADESLAKLEPGERLALNLTLPAQWLASPAARTALLDQLLDQEQFNLWHIRVQWPANVRAHRQPTDIELLQGYKRLAQLAQDEDRALILPQTGLTGWLQLAFGAKGFGVGQFSSGHAFQEQSQGGNGNNPPIERYFEPTLLHPVERTVHEVLQAQPDYTHCDCPYCTSLHSNQAWNHTLAQLHYLHWLGRLAGMSATSRTPEAAVRRAVRAALHESNRQPLAGISEPQHLKTWDQLL